LHLVNEAGQIADLGQRRVGLTAGALHLADEALRLIAPGAFVGQLEEALELEPVARALLNELTLQHVIQQAHACGVRAGRVGAGRAARRALADVRARAGVEHQLAPHGALVLAAERALAQRTGGHAAGAPRRRRDCALGGCERLHD